MKYKMIALDIDDTLLNRKKVITPKTKESLMKAQSMGVKLVIASGRLPYGVKPLALELDVLKNGGFYMGFNGGAIFNSNDEVIGKEYLDRKYIEPVYEILRPSNVTTIVHKGDVLYSDRKMNNYTDMETKAVGLPLNPVDDIARYVDWKIPKILTAGEPEELKNIQKQLVEKFGGELDIYFSAPWFLEVMPKGVNKGTGLKKICDYCGININDVIAFGDSFNDIPMIEVAGLGVAMANGEQGVKEASNYVTENDCDNDGIAEVLEKFLFED